MTEPEPDPRFEALPPATPRQTRTPMSNTKVLVILGVVVALLGLGIWAIVYNSDDHQAIRACESWVRDQIRTPTTAKFSNEHFTEAKYSFSGKDEVHGDVDAQNAYGAMIRNVFACMMEKRNGDWVAVDGYLL